MKSIATPFNVVGGRIAAVTDPRRVAEQKIIDVLLTSNYERPTIPDYGAGLQNLLFEGVDELTTADWKVDANLELGTRIPYINIAGINVQQDPVEETTVNVSVAYAAPLSPVAVLSISLGNDTFDL